MKNFLLFLLLNCLSISLFAQPKGIQITGKVTAGDNQPVEFATVMIADKTSGSPVAGTTTDEHGNFQVLSKTNNFYIEITFIGYAAKKITEFTISDRKVNLGTVSLSEDSEMLEEVEVRAERSQTEFKLDKRVFNVGKDLSTTGASALEVLNNVPSVNVNIEGEISLRGSQGVQILINGKPSVIASDGALGTITADMIQSVEVITNPSAKYEAEGTSGIINIILKKEERKGINGSFTINTGIPHNHSFGLSMNRRTEKFNLFSQVGVGYRVRPRDTENINRNLVTNNSVLSNGFEDRNELFYNVILGTDYHINKHNIITLSGSFAYEIEDQPSETNFTFQDATGQDIDKWNRTEVTEATNPKYRYELQYKKDFKDNKEHTLLFSALGNLFAKDQSSEFFDKTIQGTNRDDEQRTRTNFKDIKTTFKLDYNKPFANGFTLETGLQYVLNEVSNDFEVTDLEDGIWIKNPNFTNVFEYNQNVLGVYATGAYESNKWGLKLGLRAENTDLKTLLATTNEADSQKFTNLFPTLHTSYKINEKVSLQAGYSRRIFRPRLWDLNPFFNIRNNFNIRKGNPELQPEFTDSYEVTSIYLLGKLTANFGVYHRYTTETIERISILEEDEVRSVFQPVNLGTNNTTGMELNLKYVVNKKLTFNGDLNYNYFSRKGTFEDNVFDFANDQWSAKLNTKIKLPVSIDFEVTGQYRSAEQTVQSVNSANLFADLGLRKKFLKGRGVLSMSVRDVFASRFRESITDQPDFYLYNYGIRGRFIIFGFSYGFGKGEAMEFSGRRRR